MGTTESNCKYFVPFDGDYNGVPERSPIKLSIDWDKIRRDEGIFVNFGLSDIATARDRAEKRKANAENPVTILIKEIRDLKGKLFFILN